MSPSISYPKAFCEFISQFDCSVGNVKLMEISKQLLFSVFISQFNVLLVMKINGN